MTMGLSFSRSLLQSCPLSEWVWGCRSCVRTMAPTKPMLVLMALLKYSVEAWLVLQAMAHCTGTWQQPGQHTPGHAQHSGKDVQCGWNSQSGGREGPKPAGI